MSKMNQRLSFSKPRGYTLCSSLEKKREDCWTLCPPWPRLYRKEKKQKMVEVRRGGQGKREAGSVTVWVGGRNGVGEGGCGVVWEREGGRREWHVSGREGSSLCSIHRETL